MKEIIFPKAEFSPEIKITCDFDIQDGVDISPYYALIDGKVYGPGDTMPTDENRELSWLTEPVNMHIANRMADSVKVDGFEYRRHFDFDEREVLDAFIRGDYKAELARRE